MSDTQLDPIHGAFASPPSPLPLGTSFSDRVTVHQIDRRAATLIYQAHHEYLPRGRCGHHYDVYLDGALVGAITFDNWPSQASIRGHESADIMEVARVCIGLEMPNLASCAMATAQDEFLDEYDGDLSLLITYIHGDYDGTMFRALRGKGWEFDGVSEGRDRGPHRGQSEVYDIYTTDKERWVCEI